MNYTIKEISEKMGLTENAIRYYTDKGLMPCKRDKNNRRIFDDTSINWLQGIKCLRQCGVSIQNIKVYSDLCLLDDEESLQKRYEFILKQREEAYKRVKEAEDILAFMEHKVHHYEDIIAGNAQDDTTMAAKKLTLCE